MNRTVDIGKSFYQKAFDFQLETVEERKSGQIEDTLILTEHHAVFTAGVRPGAIDHLIWDKEMLQKQGIEFHQSNRGGDITYHGPGQIVGYPIISLKEQKDLHAYLRNIEEVLIKTVAQFDIQADRREGKTGIWIGNRKIAAIGVAVKSWVTYHGFALNVDPDLLHFQGIVPCGIRDGTVTSMKEEMGSPPHMDSVKKALILEFWKIFGKR